jgi:hypothetical protein
MRGGSLHRPPCSERMLLVFECARRLGHDSIADRDERFQ